MKGKDLTLVNNFLQCLNGGSYGSLSGCTDIGSSRIKSIMNIYELGGWMITIEFEKARMVN